MGCLITSNQTRPERSNNVVCHVEIPHLFNKIKSNGKACRKGAYGAYGMSKEGFPLRKKQLSNTKHKSLNHTLHKPRIKNRR